jgi:hypothetical protein
MKLRVLLGGFVMGAATMLVMGLGGPDEHEGYKHAGHKHEHAQPQVSPADMATMMEKWAKVAAPGENHKYLEPCVGKWDVTTRMWWGGPGTPPIVSHGTSESRWVLDKRFVLTEDKAELLMPDADGGMQKKPFTGMGLTGYDNYKNLYVGGWADNMGTQLLTMSGTRDPSGKVFTFYGQMDEPMLDMSDRMVKYVTRIINNDKHVFEMYDLAVSEDYKVFEITYTRRN